MIKYEFSWEFNEVKEELKDRIKKEFDEDFESNVEFEFDSWVEEMEKNRNDLLDLIWNNIDLDRYYGMDFCNELIIFCWNEWLKELES